ncbi:vitamin D-binding protein-like isoform X1 [Acipenser ruthenus]|uniref:vitamin D-binding protein-like isoform X1 n=1 Tax=Acipenser ruthenus TaxID=7906 RepID=UPI002741C65C|nr:vitamin D-binding protein-like isoform X1 [Acipenser ruthenus]
MKIVQIILFTAAVTFVHSRSRGKDYEKEKICQQYSMLGREKFKASGIVIYSQKFSTSTFEQVNAVLDAMVNLADKCCAEGADPNCYDEGATAMSEVSCMEDSPFPKHPGITKCCEEQSLERKLCLANLRVLSEEFPSLEEPTDDEVCKQFTADPKGYMERYLYELARRHGSVPAGLVLNATDNYSRMVASCCSSSQSKVCFLKERLQQKDSKLFLRLASHLCHSQVHFKSLSTGLAVRFGQMIPSASFEEVLPVADYLQQGLAKCCFNPNPECLIKEFIGLKTVLCTNSTLLAKYDKLEKCCTKPCLDVLPCVDSLDAQPPTQLAEIQEPDNEDLCKDASSVTIKKYFFEIGRRHHYLPIPILATIFGGFNKMVNSCCSAEDSNTCLNNKKPLMKKEIGTFISKANEICENYRKLDFTVYKERTLTHFQEKLPGATKDEINKKVEHQTEFASTCCFPKGPPLRCQKLVNTIGHTCEGDTCLLI